MSTQPTLASDKVYVHKLNAQELGFRKGKPGGAGRYFYISKSCIEYFPPLSDVVLNDHVFLELIPPHSNNPVLTKYVFHNSKTASVPEEEDRDEYRIYLNNQNDPGRDFFHPDDIIIITKLTINDDTVFKVQHVPPTASEYSAAEALLEQYGERKKTHALVPVSDISFLPQPETVKVERKIVPDTVAEEALQDSGDTPTEEPERQYVTTRSIRDSSFRTLVLYFYNYKCAITGKELVVEYNDYSNLEAAHIWAKAAKGADHPANGMALERNLHWAFDKGFFTITPDYTVEVHKAALDIPYLKSIDGQKLHLPEDSRSWPSQASIAWHREHVFGIFQQ